MKAKEIELDILSGHFDETLTRYQPPKAVQAAQPGEITPTPTPTIQEIWEQYTTYKASSVKETTQLYYIPFIGRTVAVSRPPPKPSPVDDALLTPIRPVFS